MSDKSQQNTNTAVAKTSDLKQLLEKAAPSFMQVAPKYLKVERVIKLLLAAASRNPKLMQCSQKSVLNFCMQCAQTGLEPIGPGGAWPVPYENRKTGEVEMQFIPDYRGLVNCAKRGECITDAYAEVVRQKDEFDYELGMEPRLTHKPARGDRGPLECAYCIIVLPDGVKRFVVMDAEEIKGIRSRSRASSSGPWVTDESEMWKKTVVRRAMKPFAGASPELDKAIEADDAATGLVMDPQKELREPKEKPSIPAEATETPAPEPEKPDAEGNHPPRSEAPPANDANADLNAKIKVLYDSLPAKKVQAAMKAAGIKWDDGEDWEGASVEARTALYSMLKAAK